jgi:uncharacterized membrane protein (UPF0182 family)
MTSRSRLLARDVSTVRPTKLARRLGEGRQLANRGADVGRPRSGASTSATGTSYDTRTYIVQRVTRELATGWDLPAGRGRARRLIKGVARAMRRLIRLLAFPALLLLLIPLVVAALLVAHWLASLYWFEAIGYPVMFWRPLLIRLGLFVVVFAVVLVFVWINLHLFISQVGRHQGARPHGAPQPGALLIAGGTMQVRARWLVLGEGLVAALVAFVVGLGFSGSWESFIRFVWAKPFGQTDPVFHHDIGFYVFRLPFLNDIQNALSILTFLATALIAWGYIRAGLLHYRSGQGLVGPRAAIRHLLVNAVLFLLAWAAGYVLDRYGLLTSSSGVVFGAGYTALHVTRWALWAAAALTLALAGTLVLTLTTRWAWLLPFGVGGLIAVWLAIVVVLPAIFQSFVVEPNELALETPYLARNIAATREAFGLHTVEVRRYDPKPTLDMAAIAANRDTIANIRLWDWQPLEQTFRQLQQIRSYYTFLDVDVDRYHLGGAYRQVLLSARELSDQLPGNNQSWINRRLQYTHGFGLVMSPAAEKTPDGLPVLIIQNIPPESPPSLPISQGAIYYGEEGTGYRVVDTGIKELDYPKGDQNVYTSYDGHGGVLLDSLLKRLVYAWHEDDLGILISDYVKPQSRIQLWRQIQTRIGKLAPFLVLDRDAYLVVDRGRLFWIQDAYTIGENYPYSEPSGHGVSYIRNSVKIVVDAYQGDVTFYDVDPEDPVLQVYAAAFPGLLRPLALMPEGLRAHLRFPQDLFDLQVAKYARYHMTDPQVFYNNEDLWQLPKERFGGNTVQVEPYYMLVRLPGESLLEFMLMMPMTPVDRDNMIGWMAARCDRDHYGQIVVFQLPKERLILGPTQIEAMIDQDTTISRQLSLWDQHGSHVVRGNLLVIPIDDGFLYVEPVYLRSEDNDIPQLKRVIVSDGNSVAMDQTLDEAIQAVFGAGPEPAPAGLESGPRPVGAATLSHARDALDAAQAAMRKGDWAAFGQAMQQLGQALGQSSASPAADDASRP